jgi:heat shock protein HtpX
MTAAQAVSKLHLKTYFVLSLFFGLILFLAKTVGGWFNASYLATQIGLVLILIINLLSFFFADKFILKASGAKLLKREDAAEVFELVEGVAKKANTPIPKIYVIYNNSMNAFVTGKSKNNSHLVLTGGIIEKLKSAELEAVVAHELAHVKNKDIWLMTFISVCVGVVAIAAEIIHQSRVYGKVQEKDSSGITGWLSIFLLAFAPLIATVIQFSVSRKREYLADLGAVKILGSTRSMISALEKLGKDMIPLPASYGTAHLYIANPFKDEGFFDQIFSTHPPLNARINNLKVTKI